ncbi:MAG: 30S ribosomal protein S12 methylthiotransferase RimO, partial [Ignavibacteria bacterium]|nr:30S ribosomal protein S12 methylthiotransferase RimO [Ignavibacteria bacterium]
AMGCLTERYKEELRAELPELDGIFGSNELGNVLQTLGSDLKYELLGTRVRTTSAHSAYLKISEGCDHPCSFCAIPLMRGKHFSRPPDEIVSEAELLASGGTRELVLIGQDTTYYGVDRSGERELGALLERLATTGGIDWIRLMYAYPAHFPLGILDLFNRYGNICNYIDMPVQHASDAMLKSMRRGISARALRALIDTIRDRVPGIALRTTLIVGFPGETAKEFDELLRFVEDVRFSRLGVFTYSQEDGTTAYPLGDTVAPEEKERRKGLVMELQREISLARNEALIGSRLKVLIDRKEDDRWVGRTETDAPEIDNEVFVEQNGAPLCVGEFVEVDISDASEYDLYGAPIPDAVSDVSAGTNRER